MLNNMFQDWFDVLVTACAGTVVIAVALHWLRERARAVAWEREYGAWLEPVVREEPGE